MHVLFVTSSWDASPDADRGDLPELAAALRDAGHTVGAVALAPSGPVASPTPLSLRSARGVTLVEGGTRAAGPHGGRGTRLLVRRRTREALDRYTAEAGRPDVVHAHGILPGVHMAALAGRVLGCGVVLSVHGAPDGSAVAAALPGAGVGEVRSDLQRVALRTADTDALREALTRAWHVGAWRVLPTAVDDVFVREAVSLYAQANGAVELEKARTDNVDC